MSRGNERALLGRASRRRRGLAPVALRAVCTLGGVAALCLHALPTFAQARTTASTTSPPLHEPGSAPAPTGQASASSGVSSGATGPRALPPEKASQAVADWLEGHTDVECTPTAIWPAQKVFVACGAQGYLVLRSDGGTLTLERHERPSGVVVGFFEHQGRLWAQVTEERAVVVYGAGVQESAAPHQPSQAGRSPEAPSQVEVPPKTPSVDRRSPGKEVSATGIVVERKGLEARVVVGSEDGVEPRMRMAFGDSGDVVGVVTRVEPRQSWVRLGVNEPVHLGEVGSITALPSSESRTAPRRVTGVWELRGMLRPMLNLGSFGGGVLGEFSAGMRTQRFHYGALVAPFGVASARGESTATASGYLFGAFDSQVFSAGLGLGGQTVNDPEFGTESGSGIGLLQVLRLGAVDGLHLMSRTKAVVFRQRTEFSSLEVQGQISVAAESWLVFRGGGGTEGYGYGEVAVRNLVEGSGGSGSVFLEVSIGGAGLFERSCTSDVIVTPGQEICSDTDVGGPLVGVGAEWRL